MRRKALYIVGATASASIFTFFTAGSGSGDSGCTVDFALEDDAVRASATVKIGGQTGVEMEALTAVSAALLAIYDMVKAIDKGMTIEGVRLLAKSGGRSGDWHAA